MHKLKHINEFNELLADYKLSSESVLTLSQTQLVLLVAPSSSGRNTVIRELLKTGDYHFIVSDTTREKRINDGVPEQNGVEYFFRSEEEVLQDIKDGKYLEAAVIHNQQVSGISVREIQKAQEADKIAITDAEIAGADSATSVKPDTLAIFLLPPSFEEWQRRIKKRGSMSSEEYKNRMESAATELATALDRDYYKFVINSSVQEAAKQVNSLAKMDSQTAKEHDEARQLAKQLLLDTKLLLESLK